MRVRRKWEGPWTWSFVLGLVCIVVGISGQAVKASEVEIGALTSGWSRAGLIAVGVLVLLASLLEPNDIASSDPVSASPRQAQARHERARVRDLQELLGLHGADVDGIWGPKTRLRCRQQMVGSPTDVDPRAVKALSGNKNKELVAWVQRQLNRRFQAGVLVDGLPSTAMHHAVVDLLGESDGVIGPRAYRTLTLD